MIEGIEPEKLREYVDTWQKVNAEIDTIYSLASLFALLKHFSDDQLRVESHCLVHVFNLIGDSAVQICSILDDFIGIAEARLMVQRTYGDDSQ